MDKHHFPPLEPENSMPEHLPEIPEQMAPLEDLPVIQELTFEPVIPPPEPEVSEELPAEETIITDKRRARSFFLPSVLFVLI